MNTNPTVKSDLSIERKLAELPITEPAREEALAALRTGSRISDVLLWIVGRLEPSERQPVLRPSLKH
jgi:hypothetical protein